MSTIPELTVDVRRRLHRDEFKANAVAVYMRRGMLMAAVAMANGISANLLSCWVRATEMRIGGDMLHSLSRPERTVSQTRPAAFLPMQLPTTASVAGSPIELRCELVVEPVNIRVNADRLITRVGQVFGAAQAHHGYL